jgi:hypothetical protein
MDLLNGILTPIERNLAIINMSDFPPKPPLHNTLNQKSVVPSSNKSLLLFHLTHFFRPRQGQIDIDLIRIVNLK